MEIEESSFEVKTETERFLCERLLDQKQPISQRFRALFSLRNLKGSAPRNALITAMRDSSNLLAHEAAFALGQMQDVEAIHALEDVLEDISLHPIVRHEAAEALGAIGLESNVPLLKKKLELDPAPEVRETCELALRRIEEQKNIINESEVSATGASPFLSVDPAKPASHTSSVDQLREVLLNEEKGMYERYAALFALRNHGADAAVNAIIASLGAGSALLRHEVAYVLGQLQNKVASATLSEVLRNVNEHPMVRHEAAEALGSIADDESVALLEEFCKDPEPIVAQSCEVALSMLEFERSGKSFEVNRLKEDRMLLFLHVDATSAISLQRFPSDSCYQVDPLKRAVKASMMADKIRTSAHKLPHVAAHLINFTHQIYGHEVGVYLNRFAINLLPVHFMLLRGLQLATSDDPDFGRWPMLIQMDKLYHGNEHLKPLEP